MDAKLSAGEEELAEARKNLFVPQETKEGLRDWIGYFLGIELPDGHVSVDGPNPSTCSPMEMVWRSYDAMRRNATSSLPKALAYAARDSFKSAGAAVLEVLVVLHLKRDVGHFAAITRQAQNVQKYVKEFFDRPLLKDLKVSVDSKEKTEVIWYEAADGSFLYRDEWKALADEERTRYSIVKRSIQIIVGTVEGCNSLHTGFVCVDGATEILVRGTAGRRSRKRMTARALFNHLQGIEPSGRPSPNPGALVVSVPTKDMEVLSLNMDSGSLEFKKVTWASRSKDQTVRVITKDGRKLVCTPGHPVYVWGKGFVSAGSLVLSDRLLWVCKTKQAAAQRDPGMRSGHALAECNPTSSSRWEQVLLGSLLGAGAIYRRETSNPYFSENHCQEQAAYLDWKVSILSERLRLIPNKGVTSGYTDRPEVGYHSGNSQLLLPYLSFRRTLDGLEKLGPLGLAVWFMDDGCKGNGLRFSTECFSDEQNHHLADFLRRRFGIEVGVHHYSHGERVYPYLAGGVEAKRRLVEICFDHAHPDMAYKFDVSRNTRKCRNCGSKFWFIDRGGGGSTVTCGSPLCKKVDGDTNNRCGTLRFSEVAHVEEVPGDGEWVYDFTVEGNNNFFANGLLSHNCVDEADLADEAAYKQARFIPSVYAGIDPFTLIISTRKSNAGIVQRELDNAEKSGLAVWHWNIIDVTEFCPPARHLPAEPKVPIYRSDDLLAALSEEQWSALAAEDRDKYERDEGYAGCLKNCKLWVGCRGALATKPPFDVGVSLLGKNIPTLRTLSNTQTRFVENAADSEDLVKAEMWCWKASSEALIYPRLSPLLHLKTASEMWSIVSGEPVPQGMTRDQLVERIRERGGVGHAGYDWGFSHNFVPTAGFLVGANLLILFSRSLGELDDEEKAEFCRRHFGSWDTIGWPDTEAPNTIKTFRKRGFRMRDWKKGAGSVTSGIQAVRSQLWQPLQRCSHLYFLRGDAGVENLFKAVSKWEWMRDRAGELTDVPSETFKDECDSLRYLVMNACKRGNKLVASADSDDEPRVMTMAQSLALPVPEMQRYTTKNWASQVIAEAVSSGDSLPSDDGTSGRGRKGRFAWNI